MAALRIFDDVHTLGRAAATVVADQLEKTPPEGRFVLGCPAGRSPLSTFSALGELAAGRNLDFSNVHLVLMDEYVERHATGLRLCSRDAHYSCRRFIERELRAPLNQRLTARKRLRADHVHVPDPRDPAAYESLLGTLGGIDLFLLASGASDGHVAFNSAGTPLDAVTRVITLAEATRRDNLSTFPAFRNVDETPTLGVSVGPGTIVRWSRRCLLLLTGKDKTVAFRRITSSAAYDPDWPATVVHACDHVAGSNMIFADRAAARGAATLEGGDSCDR